MSWPCDDQRELFIAGKSCEANRSGAWRQLWIFDTGSVFLLLARSNGDDGLIRLDLTEVSTLNVHGFGFFLQAVLKHFVILDRP